jgi:hypothetical protein
MPYAAAAPGTLSRRRMLATGALAAALTLLPRGGGLGASPALGAAARRRPPRRLSSFGLDVRGSELRGGRVSGTIDAPRRFDLIGARGAGVRGSGLEVRVRPHGGRWSSWAPLDVTRHGPDGQGDLATSDPVWVGGADELQLRSRRPLGGVRLHFVAVPTEARTASPRASAAAARASAVAGSPAIIGRDVWEAGRCPPRSGPSYGEVQLGFVHHTVSANEYGPQDSAAIVLAICKFHRDSNGWKDIGYNFVVDRFGQIFEGRAGGIDRAVIGAQAEGYNRFSTGVACLGTFTSVPQTPQGLDAVARLLAWKLAIHGAPVAGQVTVTSGGGGTNRFKAGTAVTFERISGHRDGCATACPGNALYAQLPEIRARAAGVPVVADVARLTATPEETRVVYGEDAVFAGRLVAAGGVPAAGVRVSVQKRGASGRYTTVARATTESDGSWRVRFPWRAAGPVRATGIPPGGSRIRSGTVQIGLVPLVTVKAATSRIQAGRRIRISGVVRPHAAARVLVEKEGKDGRYRRVRESRLRVSKSRYSSDVLLRDPGLYRLTVRTGPSRSPTATAPVYVRAVRDIERNPAPSSGTPGSSSSGGAGTGSGSAPGSSAGGVTAG